MAQTYRLNGRVRIPDSLAVYNAGELVGRLSRQSDGWAYERLASGERSDEAVRLIDGDMPPECVRETICETRVFPRERVNARQVLDEIGLDTYDEWDVLVANEGRFPFDKLKMIPWEEAL